MIEIENFLSQDICDYSINYFRRNKKHSLKFNKRKKLNLQDEKKDPVILNLITRYSKIYPNYYLKNIELIYWPIGEHHDWHDDTIYYDKTTITYLNKNYEGGRTIVKNYEVSPETGKIILFDSDIKHKVSPLLNGERYVILAWYKHN